MLAGEEPRVDHREAEDIPTSQHRYQKGELEDGIDVARHCGRRPRRACNV